MIIFGLRGILFVDPSTRHDFDVVLIPIFGETGKIWVFCVICAGFILLPIGIYWSRIREDRHLNAYFARRALFDRIPSIRLGTTNKR